MASMTSLREERHQRDKMLNGHFWKINGPNNTHEHTDQRMLYAKQWLLYELGLRRVPMRQKVLQGTALVE